MKIFRTASLGSNCSGSYKKECSHSKDTLFGYTKFNLFRWPITINSTKFCVINMISLFSPVKKKYMSAKNISIRLKW